MNYTQYFIDKSLMRKLYNLYSLEPEKYYNMPKKDTMIYDKFLTTLIKNSFFRFRWLLYNNIDVNTIHTIARTFGIEIIDQDVAIHNNEPIIIKMFTLDKKRYLYKNLKKFIISFSIDNKQFKKINVKF